MNLSKLFDAQKILDARIEAEHPRVESEDRLAKKILALLVELGECANEYRSWKYWSNDQDPRNMVKCEKCNGKGKARYNVYDKWLIECSSCNGNGYTNPILEEYVDGLHFVLALGVEWGFQGEKPFLVHLEKVEKMFLKNYKPAIMLMQCGRSHKSFYYGELLSNYLGLGKALGFTWEQIEQAYFEKNAINLRRQDDGY